MDKREQLKNRTVFQVPANHIESIKNLLDSRVYYYRLLDQDRINQKQAERLDESYAAEVCRLNEDGVSLTLLRMVDIFSAIPRRTATAYRWQSFNEYLLTWNAYIEISAKKPTMATA